MVPSKAKKEEAVIAPEETEAELPEVLEDGIVEPVGVGIPASAPGGPVPGRKSLGVKEPIVFKWKVIGRSGSMFVTLFKSVEREEVEAQLERLTRDGYYTHLQILEASAKVEQPPQPKEPKKIAKAKEPAAKPSEKSSQQKSPPPKASSKSAAPSKKAPAGKSEKSSAKAAKSKLKPSSKRTAKKK